MQYFKVSGSKVKYWLNFLNRLWKMWISFRLSEIASVAWMSLQMTSDFHLGYQMLLSLFVCLFVDLIIRLLYLFPLSLFADLFVNVCGMDMTPDDFWLTFGIWNVRRGCMTPKYFGILSAHQDQKKCGACFLGWSCHHGYGDHFLLEGGPAQDGKEG